MDLADWRRQTDAVLWILILTHIIIQFRPQQWIRCFYDMVELLPIRAEPYFLWSSCLYLDNVLKVNSLCRSYAPCSVCNYPKLCWRHHLTLPMHNLPIFALSFISANMPEELTYVPVFWTDDANKHLFFSDIT